MLNGLGKRYGVFANKSGGRGIQTRADFSPGSSVSGGGFNATSVATSGNYGKPILDGFIPDNDVQLRAIFKDIYLHDPVSGSAVDLISEIPFSDFTLSSLPDQDMLRTYARSLEAINVKTLLPELTKDYQVKGAHLSVINFDDESKEFNSIMPQDLDFCILTALPIYGHDPIIDLKVPPHVKKLLESPDPRIQKAFEKYGDDWKKMVGQGSFPLDPRMTLYIPRRTFTTSTTGNSYYRRILPVWLMEKALMRGTIDLSYRRQKSILHIMAGSDEWEPNNNELSQITNLFIQADVDPTGAVIATRPEIQTNEIRSGSDFWRIDEVYDSLTTMKLRALGISESFLSSEATLSNMETSLSVFLEQIRSFRELITRKVFYQRVFPLIAVENDFKITNERLETRGWVKTSINRRGEKVYSSTITGQKLISARTILGKDADEGDFIDITKYHMPKLQWHKPLKPEADENYLNVLATLEEKGLPIPLRVWAAAGGQSITDIMNSLQEDTKLRKKVDKYKKTLPKPPQEEAADMFSGASFIPGMISNERQKLTGANRDFSTIEMRDPQTGKVLSRKGRSVITERSHKVIAKALSNLASKNNDESKKEADAARKRIYHYSKSAIFGSLSEDQEK